MIFHTCPHHHLKLWWENFLSPNGPNSEKKIFLVDLSISWNFLHFWFSCDFSHMPPPPPQTLMRKFSKSKWAKQWKKIFFSGFINFMKFPAFLVQLWFFTHAPTTTSNFDEKIFQVQMGQTVKKIILVDLSISWNFLHFLFRCDF